jgi:hypothetical protein
LTPQVTLISGDRVAVGVVADQYAAEVVAGLGVERFVNERS